MEAKYTSPDGSAEFTFASGSEQGNSSRDHPDLAKLLKVSPELGIIARDIRSIQKQLNDFLTDRMHAAKQAP